MTFPKWRYLQQLLSAVCWIPCAEMLAVKPLERLLPTLQWDQDPAEGEFPWPSVLRHWHRSENRLWQAEITQGPAVPSAPAVPQGSAPLPAQGAASPAWPSPGARGGPGQDWAHCGNSQQTPVSKLQGLGTRAHLNLQIHPSLASSARDTAGPEVIRAAGLPSGKNAKYFRGRFGTRMPVRTGDAPPDLSRSAVSFSAAALSPVPAATRCQRYRAERRAEDALSRVPSNAGTKYCSGEPYLSLSYCSFMLGLLVKT